MAGVETGSMVSTLVRTLLAAGAMGLAVVAFIMALPGLHPLFIAGGGGLLGIAVYLGAGLILGLEEIRWMPRLVGR
jgi:hypothetical protein